MWLTRVKLCRGKTAEAKAKKTAHSAHFVHLPEVVGSNRPLKLALWSQPHGGATALLLYIGQAVCQKTRQGNAEEGTTKLRVAGHPVHHRIILECPVENLHCPLPALLHLYASGDSMFHFFCHDANVSISGFRCDRHAAHRGVVLPVRAQ